MTIRNRITELRHVRAGDLKANPKNWRKHPKPQRDALQAVLDEVGYADALIVRETPDGLELLDGHLRADLTPDVTVPVLVTDLDDDEADIVLATLDPLAAMAEPDTERLKALVDGLAANATEAMAELLENLELVQAEPTDPYAEWVGMPEFEQPDDRAFRRITVHLRDQESVDLFVKRLGIAITDKTRYVYYPDEEPVESTRGLAWAEAE